MPVVRIEMLSGRTPEQKRALAETVTRDVAEIAKCTRESVQVVFTSVDREDWAVGGRLTSDPPK
jgi:4-oxalocrotonate tautomerase